MATWNPELYLRFSDERIQPCMDLAARVGVAQPQRIADLGCGPGNSTAVLRLRFAGAHIVGIDNSPQMLAQARASDVDAAWELGDMADWQADEPYDLVFSNAAIHWLAEHERLVPRLLSSVRPGGQLAFQIPAHLTTPVHQRMHEVSMQPRWRDKLQAAQHAVTALPPGRYYDILAPHCTRVEIWQTDYYHVLDHAEDIVVWMSSTGLRPFLEALDDQEQGEFVREYTALIRASYPVSANGKVLYPFRRTFVIATRME